jgi:hypothetical protein
MKTASRNRELSHPWEQISRKEEPVGKFVKVRPTQTHSCTYQAVGIHASFGNSTRNKYERLLAGPHGPNAFCRILSHFVALCRTLLAVRPKIMRQTVFCA